MLYFGDGQTGCCEVIEQRSTDAKVRWDILSLEASLGEQVSGIGAHQPLYTGDEMLFSPDDLRLLSIRIKVPEVNAELRLDKLKQDSGAFAQLRLVERTSFEPRRMLSRNYDWEEDVLLVLATPQLDDARSWSEVCLAPNLSVLCRGENLVAWRLGAASTLIASPLSDDMPCSPRSASPEHRHLLGRYLAQVDDGFCEQLEGRETAARQKLLEFRDLAGSGSADGVSEVLKAWTEDMLDRFYS